MVKIIAIYLPQFHPIPENDRWWGKGFTEWTNVGRAKPLFKGHYQPRVPADLGYYDLRLPEVREEQAKLAHEYGIEGFCYYHYWFGNGRRLLERPFNEVLASGKPDFPFCLCWANHTWSNKTWEKSSAKIQDTILMEQQYLGVEDYTMHFNAVLPAFKDKRYIQVDGKPIFFIYHPLDIPDMKLFIETWQKLARQNDLNGIYFVGMSPSTWSHVKQSDGSVKVVLPNLKSSADVYKGILNLGFDAVNSNGKRRGELLTKGKYFTYFRELMLRFGLNKKLVYDYPKTVKNFFAPEDKWDNVFPMIMAGYDRTARIGNGEGIFVNNTPEHFKKHVMDAINIVKNKPENRQIILLNAWNEWAEGCYVEPDLKYGHGYLRAIKEALEEADNKSEE